MTQGAVNRRVSHSDMHHLTSTDPRVHLQDVGGPLEVLQTQNLLCLSCRLYQTWHPHDRAHGRTHVVAVRGLRTGEDLGEDLKVQVAAGEHRARALAAGS